MSGDEMIYNAQTTNTIMTWMKRGMGWIICFIGYSSVTQIITTSADIVLNWIPLVGSITTTLLTLGVFVTNFILTTCTTIPIIAVAWIRYRPFLGLGLLVLSIGLVFYVSSRVGNNNNNQEKKKN